ncbi:uncharacterized protein LOC131224898 [Magnolia sinica]|uniref:uncharacterized protein LOC131224898 n=1 Tax=Magnolia sinica TaxID=86752 RepID=UPI00265A8632|nr:uncharacterized protein LOC131224898 [Magnolia sinica]
MAGAAEARFLSPSFPSSHCILKSMKIQSSFSSLSLPHKPINKTNRKNYLRPKLPISPNCPSPLQQIPNPTKDLFQEEGKKEQEKEQDQDVQGKDGKTELDLSSSAISNPFTFGYGNSFVKIALCGFGLFVFQTICTVWFLSKADPDEKSRSEYSGAGSSLPEEVDQSKIGDVGVSLNEPEVEKKVSEIRIMAKEARAVERKNKTNASPDSSSVVGEDGNEIVVEDGVSSIKTEIRKEVDQHLVSLLKDLRLRKEKNLNSSSLDTKGGNSALGKKPKSVIPSMNARNYPNGFGVLKNYRSRSESDGNGLDSSDQERGVDVSDGNFKESGVAGTEEEESWWLRDEVFEGIVKKVCANEEAGRDLFGGLDSEEEISFFQVLERKFEREGESAKQWMEEKLEGIDFRNGGIRESSEVSPLRKPVGPYEMIQSTARGNVSDITTTSESAHGTTISGIKNNGTLRVDFQKDPPVGDASSHCDDQSSQISQGKSNPSEGSEMGTKSRELETQNFQSSINGNQDMSTVSRKQFPSTGNGSSKKGLRTRRAEHKSVRRKVKDGQSDVETTLWWMKLPHVFAVFWLRESNPKGTSGLYSLEMNSHSEVERLCLVAFEDRGDATNMCHILKSFFQDLGDFSAEAILLSIKEVEEIMKSKGVMATVVKKGQLQLYAGQALEDVERALHSILE